jgi:DNA modification methylase
VTPFVSDPDFTLYVGDVLDVLDQFRGNSVDCCVTSPPYWGLRDYGHDGQLGLESTPEGYVERMTAVFAEVRRVLTPTGTLWLNIGDSYAGHNLPGWRPGNESKNQGNSNKNGVGYVEGAKPKDLVGIPWRLAFALQAEGWYLRSDIIWSKPNPMPESVTDRPTKAHEYLFLLTKSPRYFYDAAAIAEPAAWDRWGTQTNKKKMPGAGSWLRDKTKAELDATVRPRHRKQDNHENVRYAGFNDRWDANEANGTAPKDRNKRTVWTIATESYAEAHFATFPQALVEPCIKAGCPEGGVVLDPFMGSGTTALVARRLGRRSVGIELNPEYARLAAKRLSQLSILALPDAA